MKMRKISERFLQMGRGTGQPRQRRAAFLLAAMLATVGSVAQGAVVLTGGPTYSPPGGGSCTLSGTAGLTAGATWTCAGLSPLASSALFFGIKANTGAASGTGPFGESMRSAQPVSTEIFSFGSASGNTITYTGQTQIYNLFKSGGEGLQPVFTRVVLTFQNGTGSLLSDSSTQALSGANGAVHTLWKVAAGSFTVNAKIEASASSTGPWSPALTYFGVPSSATPPSSGVSTRSGTDTEIAHVDMGFYFSSCGDNVVDLDSGETCDLGSGVNGQSGSCCSSTCTFRPAGSECRANQGVCDVPEVCSGTSSFCPVDSRAPAGTLCRAAAVAGDADITCDVAEVCDGSSITCPTNSFVSAGVKCREVTGPCDVAEFCTGTQGVCPTNSFASTATVCRTSVGPCDLADTCSGGSASCPTDLFAAEGTVCRVEAPGTPCDVAEECTGTSNRCPDDGFKPDTAVCRAPAGDCDRAELCTGLGVNCPADVYLSGTETCRPSAGVCDLAEKCDGNTPTCPPDLRRPTTFQCRSVAGSCDVADFCDGVDPECPEDEVLPDTVVCRSSSGACDIEERCTGGDAACPADSIQSDEFACRPAAGVCDEPELCDGSTKQCPEEDVKSGEVCRPAADLCDQPEVCDGESDDCPAEDLALPVGTLCRPIAEESECDVAEVCNGTSKACPADAFQPSSVVCRAAAPGGCDIAESCTGDSAFCPDDEFINEGEGCLGEDGNTCLNTCVEGQCLADVREDCCGNGVPDFGEQCDDGNQSSEVDACPSDPAQGQDCRYTDLIRAKAGNPAKDPVACQLQWNLVNPSGKRDRFGFADGVQVCFDNDPTCDLDPEPGVCRLTAVLCLNTKNEQLPNCPANGVSELTFFPAPKSLSKLPEVLEMVTANREQVEFAYTEGLLNPEDPEGGYTNGLPIPSEVQNACSEPMEWEMFAATKGTEKGRYTLQLRMRTKDSTTPRPKAKVTNLRVSCWDEVLRPKPRRTR